MFQETPKWWDAVFVCAWISMKSAYCWASLKPHCFNNIDRLCQRIRLDKYDCSKKYFPTLKHTVSWYGGRELWTVLLTVPIAKLIVDCLAEAYFQLVEFYFRHTNRSRKLYHLQHVKQGSAQNVFQMQLNTIIVVTVRNINQSLTQLMLSYTTIWAILIQLFEQY